MKLYKIIYCALFFIILAIPLAGMLWYKEPEVTENKELAEPPGLLADGRVNIRFLSELDEYFSDHFAYRQELVTANAVIMGQMFAQSSEELAIVGKDDWLYLKVTLDDYQGTNRMSERGIDNVVTIIRLMQEYTESQGKKFVFAGAPNKNTLYPQYMPYYYTQSSDLRNLQRVTEKLSQSGVSYVDLEALFREQNDILYHAGDSHWDNRGAGMVQHELLNKVSVPHTDFTKLEADVRNDFQGDIDKILYPQNRHPETEYDYSRYLNYAYEGTSDVTATTVETRQEQGNGMRLLCFRDSFGNSLLPFLAQDFDYAKFSKAIPYRMDLMYKEGYDVCIVELVERNLVHLIKFAPVMPAPLRAFSEVTESCESDKTTYERTEFEEYSKYSGIADEAYIDDESPVYIRFSGEEAGYVVEAMPCDESSVSGTPSDYGYVAYIGMNAFPAGTYRVELITQKEGKYYSQVLEDAYIIP